jgi:exonuclease SbcD
MRILHTADWHLGQKFITQSRETEQQLALDWLYNMIVQEKPDVLIVAGDIFDVSNPPVSAEEMYYQFLTRLTKTDCRYVVIIGGNHDSPFRLNAPRGLLRALNMYVVGAASSQPEDDLIQIKAEDGTIMGIIAAVPFLRERDFNVTTSGETADDRVRRIQQGIIHHYQRMADAIKDFDGVAISTGHLYAKGASTHEEQQNIYLGNLDNIAAEQFPDRFHYIALGHIHRMQKVGKQERIRYCGSLIPLSFSEKTDKKGIIIADFDPKKGLVATKEIETPVFRQLVSIKGSLSEIEQKLSKLHHPELPLPTWVEVVITGDPGVPMVDRHLRVYAQDMHLDILKIKVEHSTRSLSEQVPKEDLADLSPEEVFLKKCDSAGLNEEKTLLMQQEFAGLRTWMDEQ